MNKNGLEIKKHKVLTYTAKDQGIPMNIKLSFSDYLLLEDVIGERFFGSNFNDISTNSVDVELRLDTEPKNTPEYSEDDGCLFYHLGNIRLHYYFGQDDRITSKNEKDFLDSVEIFLSENKSGIVKYISELNSKIEAVKKNPNFKKTVGEIKLAEKEKDKHRSKQYECELKINALKNSLK